MTNRGRNYKLRAQTGAQRRGQTWPDGASLP